VAGKQNICAKMTEICINFSFSILHLILRLEDDVMSFMRITSEEMTVECSEFDKIWVSTSESSSPKIYTCMYVCVFADGLCKQAVEFFKSRIRAL
jgi:vacuolar protein sorting-associated protein 13A/C